MEDGAPASPRAAVLFRTHFWDGFAERQFRRLLDVAEGLDVFVVVNRTGGACPSIPHDRVAGFTDDDLVAMGLPRAGEGELVWYNIDYPWLWFAARHPAYTHIVVSEYDAVVNRPLLPLVAEAVARGVEVIGVDRDPTFADWMYRHTCSGLYPAATVQKRICPFAILSRAALTYLRERRLAHAEALRGGRLERWPFCEAFIPSELQAGGFKLAEVSEFGAAERFDFMPAILEDDLPSLRHQAFLHPVLDRPRFIASKIKYENRPETFFWPFGEFHRDLRRFPFRDYRAPLLRSLRARSRHVGRKLLSRRLGLARTALPQTSTP